MNTNASPDAAANAAPDNHATEALVLSCMDFRMTGHVSDFLAGKGLRGRYDLVAIAGAAIGVMYTGKPEWGEVFWEHVDLARELHGIRRVVGHHGICTYREECVLSYSVRS